LKQNLSDPTPLPDFSTIDRFVSVSEAARILGFSNYQSVNHLVDRGQLQAHALPHTSRRRILLSDISRLIEKQKREQERFEKLGMNPLEKAGRGRPRKY
jgi:hypothetical protein